MWKLWPPFPALRWNSEFIIATTTDRPTGAVWPRSFWYCRQYKHFIIKRLDADKRSWEQTAGKWERPLYTIQQDPVHFEMPNSRIRASLCRDPDLRLPDASAKQCRAISPCGEINLKHLLLEAFAATPTHRQSAAEWFPPGQLQGRRKMATSHGPHQESLLHAPAPCTVLHGERRRKGGHLFAQQAGLSAALLHSLSVKSRRCITTTLPLFSRPPVARQMSEDKAAKIF